MRVFVLIIDLLDFLMWFNVFVTATTNTHTNKNTQTNKTNQTQITRCVLISFVFCVCVFFLSLSKHKQTQPHNKKHNTHKRHKKAVLTLIWLPTGPHIGPKYALILRIDAVFRVDSEFDVPGAPFGAKMVQNGHFQIFKKS